MILPSQLLAPTTEGTGYFECATPVFAPWLLEAFGSGWSQRAITASTFTELVEHVRPVTPPGPNLRYLLAPVDGWTALLNDAPLGTDVGVLPMHAARTLECRAVRAVSSSGASGSFDATILEVFDPAAKDDSSLCRRSIFAANDGGVWRFGQFGEPFPFEDTDAYSRRRIKDRFTPEMLESYLVALGVPVDREPDISAAVLTEPP